MRDNQRYCGRETRRKQSLGLPANPQRSQPRNPLRKYYMTEPEARSRHLHQHRRKHLLSDMISVGEGCFSLETVDGNVITAPTAIGVRVYRGERAG